MKKSLASTRLMMSAFAAMGGDTVLRNNHNEQPKGIPNPCAKKYTIFKEEEGVIKTIQDYKLIKQGKCKKGKLKQQRIISKINEWIESGYLTIEDIS